MVKAHWLLDHSDLTKSEKLGLPKEDRKANAIIKSTLRRIRNNYPRPIELVLSN